MSIKLYPAVGDDGHTTVWSPDLDIGEIVAILNAALDLESAASLAVLMSAGANFIQRLAEELDMEPAELACRLEDGQFDALLNGETLQPGWCLLRTAPNGPAPVYVRTIDDTGTAYYRRMDPDEGKVYDGDTDVTNLESLQGGHRGWL